jgi:ribosomal protein S27E
LLIISCPSCGAEVRFRSHAAVMAVCEYCRTGVLKDPGSVGDLGKIAEVLEDYSPVQLGTSGTWATRPFTVVGRLQLRYDAGFWNEWYLLFDDGTNGWLGDASGQFTVTVEKQVEGTLPAFEDLQAGHHVMAAGQRWMAADVRTARCTGGQGELPFRVGQGWEARVADLRAGSSFITLDYSDGGTPLVYAGVPVTLDSLRPQLLRDDLDIQRSAGRFRGQLQALDCPSCGSAITYLPGMTANLVCPACRAQLDAASPQVEVLRAGERLDAVPTTLPLGAEGTLGNQKLTVIGVMRREDDEGAAWTEYLLYGSRAGFTWLVETDDGWQRSDVLDDWPAEEAESAVLDNIRYRHLADYPARVTFAAGAFNWRVAVGDVAQVTEFRQGQTALAAERSEHEITWSRSKPVAWDQLQAWFPTTLKAGAAPPRVPGTLAQGRRYRNAARMLIIATGVVNAIPLISNFGATFSYSVLAALALYLPAVFLDNNDSA